jgi:hypothetical protein
MISPRIFGCLSMACLTSASPAFAILYSKARRRMSAILSMKQTNECLRLIQSWWAQITSQVFSQQNQTLNNKQSRPTYPDDILKHKRGLTFWTGRTAEGRCYQDSGTKLHIVCTSHFIFQHWHIPSLFLLHSNSDYHCTTESASHCV